MGATPLIEACCAPVLQAPLDEQEARRLAAGFKVLAEPARLRLLSLLAERPGLEACVCDLTGPLGLGQPTVSHHLRILYDAGLLTRERRGTWTFYRLAPDRLRVLSDALALPEPAPAA